MSLRIPKSVVIATALLAAGFFAAYLRFRPHLGEGAAYTDGSRVYESTSGERIRFAVWEDPEPLSGEVNSSGNEGRPTVSPDGRWMVFSVGEVGLNSDLYLAELIDGEPQEVRPLALANTDWDETAPAFGPDTLYFASNRPGSVGGLDLYRMPYRGGAWGEIDPVGPGVNTVANETDPCPLPGSAALAFSSDRMRGMRTDYELYRATPITEGGETTWELSALEELNSPFDEREPSYTADGRTVVFASDRSGSAGGFDLYRSLADRGEWLEPEPITDLNGPTSERGPYPSRDGFSMLFSIEGAEGNADLFRARSLELFRRPGRPIGWLDLLILAALLVLALLAYLAKRWDKLEVVYKCFLVSMLVHLGLLWWLQRVVVEGGEVDLQGSSALFQVALAMNSASASASNQARNGELEVARRESLQESDSPQRHAAEGQDSPTEVQAEAMELSRPEARAGDAPSRAQSAETRSTEAAVAEVTLPATAAESFEPMSAEAPALALAARSTETARSEVPTANPNRAAQTATTSSAANVAPERQDLERPQRLEPTSGESVPSHTERLVAAPDDSRQERSRVSLPAPQSSQERQVAAAPAFALPAPSHTDVPDRQPEMLARSQPTQATRSQEAFEMPEPRRFEAQALAVPSQQTAPQRLTTPTRSPARDLPSVALPSPAREAPARREESEESQELESFPARELASLLPDRPRRTERPTRDQTQPSRWSANERRRPEERAPTFTPLETVERESSAAAIETPTRWEHTPYKSRFGIEKTKALEVHGGSEETEAAVAAGLEYLAGIQHRRGHWGSRNYRDDKYDYVHIGKTGLSMLAFLGAGHTHRSDTQYSPVVLSAVEYLLAIQDEDRGHFGLTSSYGHAIATYALAECYALTKDTSLEQPIQQAVRWILAHQETRTSGRRFGGWSYYYPSGRDYDGWPRASITAWQVMALESARLGGIDVPDQTFDGAKQFLTNSWDDRMGAFRYSHDPDRVRSNYPTLPGSTPASMFALSLMGEDLSSARWSEAVRFVMRRMPDGYRYRGDDAFVSNATGNLYFWYYSTLALFRMGGPSWNQWNEAMKETLLGSQQDDGSWRPISIYADYANDSDDDRSYTTAMCVLTLEVYYRYFTPLMKVK